MQSQAQALIGALALVLLGVVGIVAFLWLFVTAMRIFGGTSGLEERYPPRPIHPEGLKLGNAWFVTNFWILAAADRDGLHLEPSLGGGQRLFVPWAQLRPIARLPGVHVFRFAGLYKCVFVRAKLVPVGTP